MPTGCIEEAPPSARAVAELVEFAEAFDTERLMADRQTLYLCVIEETIGRGITPLQIAHALGITPRRLNRWRQLGVEKVHVDDPEVVERLFWLVAIIWERIAVGNTPKSNGMWWHCNIPRLGWQRPSEVFKRDPQAVFGVVAAPLMTTAFPTEQPGAVNGRVVRAIRLIDSRS